MLQPRLHRPTRATTVSLHSLAASLSALTLVPPKPSPTTWYRHASHAAQGRANGPKNSPGRRLGAKKTASQYVIPGNIIFKQRGTKWHPGENVDIGKDHTIYATVAGYVRYYRDPLRHPKRRFIGVSLEREGAGAVLPTPRNAATRRRLGMYATPIKSTGDDAAWLESHMAADSGGETASTTSGTTTTSGAKPTEQQTKPMEVPRLIVSARPRYNMHRETNWSIGRTAERKGITVRDYDRSDRWLAWRKRNQKIKRVAVYKAVKASRKAKVGNVKKKVQSMAAGRSG